MRIILKRHEYWIFARSYELSIIKLINLIIKISECTFSCSPALSISGSTVLVFSGSSG
jgi:hypothetical protein